MIVRLRFHYAFFLTRCDSTRGTENILDIVITNNGDLFRDVDVLPTRMSDHDSISIILSHHFNHASVKEQGKLQKDTPVGFNSLNFHKADYDGINADLCKIKWDSLKAESSDEDFSITFIKFCYLFVKSIHLKKYSPINISQNTRSCAIRSIEKEGRLKEESKHFNACNHYLEPFLPSREDL